MIKCCKLFSYVKVVTEAGISFQYVLKNRYNSGLPRLVYFKYVPARLLQW